ncbi:MAG: Rdx family protein [Firmicutes bacterium]|nr:Rdx family protein [Bacillota bacterium]
MDHATRVVSEVLGKYKNQVQVARLIPSSGGVFEVRANGRTIFSKKAENNRFPEPNEIVNRLSSQV